MPLLSNVRKCILLRKSRNITLAESDSSCVKTIISFLLTIQTHLAIQMSN